MEDEVIVACHAPVLSLLLYETARSVHDQKGLLIGEVFNEVISKKTDDNEINKEQKTVIYIKHCMPMNHEVFGSVGDINRNEIHKLGEQKQIVGWYSFRRNTRVFQNTLCEMLIHKTLLDMIPGCKPEFFVAAFMSASIAPTFSTHTYNHLFTRYHPNRERFEPLKLKIYSLSDKTVNSSSTISSFPLSHRFKTIISSFQKEENPVKSVLSVHNKVGDLLSTFNTKLQEQDNIRSELENEVKKLRKQLGLDEKQDIVPEEEPEKEEFPKENLIHFNSKVKYNPTRTSNPIKVSIMSPVPDDDDDDEDKEESDNEIIEVDKDEKDLKPPATPNSSMRSYAAILGRSSPGFLVKTPKLRPGISPHPNTKKGSVSNNDMDDGIDSQDMFESAEETEENLEKVTAVNNSQNSNQMDTDR